MNSVKSSFDLLRLNLGESATIDSLFVEKVSMNLFKINTSEKTQETYYCCSKSLSIMIKYLIENQK